MNTTNIDGMGSRKPELNAARRLSSDGGSLTQGGTAKDKSTPMTNIEPMKPSESKKTYKCKKCGRPIVLDNLISKMMEFFDMPENSGLCSVCVGANYGVTAVGAELYALNKLWYGHKQAEVGDMGRDIQNRLAELKSIGGDDE